MSTFDDQLLLQKELKRKVPTLLEKHLTQLTPNKYKQLVRWMIEVQIDYMLSDASLFHAVAILNQFLVLMAPREIEDDEIQLFGVTSLYIAQKYENADKTVFPSRECSFITADTYTRKQVVDAERTMMEVMRFDISLTTAYDFFKNDDTWEKEKITKLTLFLLRMALSSHSLMTGLIDSHRAAGAELAATCALTSSHEEFDSCSDGDVRKAAVLVAKFHEKLLEHPNAMKVFTKGLIMHSIACTPPNAHLVQMA